MNGPATAAPGPLRLQLPATSANLGPAFDAAGLALDRWLDIRVQPAAQDMIEASGRDREVVGRLEGNLLLQTYHELVPAAPALALRIHNDIPLGMGCGSSAAALLAGVALANHFGRLGLSPEDVRDEACRREGHPDNVAACFHGGFTVSALDPTGQVHAASFGAELGWWGYLVLPAQGLSTSVARGLLPPAYPRADVVSNIQATALLVAAFALGRADLLLPGTADCLHQPYRAAVCPLLPRLLPLRGGHGICSVMLSGAGPSVLCLPDQTADPEQMRQVLLTTSGELASEVLLVRIAPGALFTSSTD